MKLNAILERELRVRSRSKWFTIGLTVEMAILILALTITWVGQDQNADVTSLSSVGRTMAWVCTSVLLTIIFVSVPAVTGSSIAGEKERDTMTVLQVTPLRGREIVMGKVLATMLWVVFAVITAAPIFGICYAFGGVSFVWVALVLVFLLLTAFGTASVSVLASAHASSSSRGITMAYLYVVLAVIIAGCVPFVGALSLLVVPFVAIAMASSHLEVRT